MVITHEQIERFAKACADMVQDLRADIAKFGDVGAKSAGSEGLVSARAATKKKTRKTVLFTHKHRDLVPAWKRMRDRGLNMTQCCRNLHISNEHGRLMEDAAYGMKLKEAK